MGEIIRWDLMETLMCPPKSILMNYLQPCNLVTMKDQQLNRRKSKFLHKNNNSRPPSFQTKLVPTVKV
eukprot:91745-Hanusia_phi.AAC.1